MAEPKTTQPPASTPQTGVSHPGMMGDGTEEQNLDQEGDPKARITEDEVKDAFGKDDAKPATK